MVSCIGNELVVTGGEYGYGSGHWNRIVWKYNLARYSTILQKYGTGTILYMFTRVVYKARIQPTVYCEDTRYVTEDISPNY
jgi:hypothetical protein